MLSERESVQEQEALKQKALDMFLSADNEKGRDILRNLFENGTSISPTTEEEKNLLDQIGDTFHEGGEEFSVGRYFPLEKDARTFANGIGGASPKSDEFTYSNIRLKEAYDAVVARDFKLIIPRREGDQVVTKSGFHDKAGYGQDESPVQGFLYRQFKNLADRRETATMSRPGQNHGTPEQFATLARVDRAICDSLRTEIAKKEKEAAK